MEVDAVPGTKVRFRVNTEFTGEILDDRHLYRILRESRSSFRNGVEEASRCCTMLGVHSPAVTASPSRVINLYHIVNAHTIAATVVACAGLLHTIHLVSAHDEREWGVSYNMTVPLTPTSDRRPSNAPSLSAPLCAVRSCRNMRSDAS